MIILLLLSSFNKTEFSHEKYFLIGVNAILNVFLNATLYFLAARLYNIGLITALTYKKIPLNKIQL